MSITPQVSVILPVFNGEKYIKGAIDSVLSQTTPFWELLIVDDGSKDATSTICDAYSIKDSRIHVFHQTNSGVNIARAKGIDNACGEFLTFLDADDSLLPNALEYMTGLFHDGIDIVASGSTDEILRKTDYLKALWGKGIGPELWGKMFRLDSFKKIEYALDRRIAMGEDLILNSVYALNINLAFTFSREVYAVNRVNETSVTRTFKHNWEYEKFYFRNVEELFLSKCDKGDSYEEILLLVNKSWLNAIKYVMLDGGHINYTDTEFTTVRDYFKSKKQSLGPSEKLLFAIRDPSLYRFILKTYLRIIGKRKQ